MGKVREPVLLVVWGDDSLEHDEIGEIKMLLEATLFDGDVDMQEQYAPNILAERISTPDVSKMIQRVRLLLAGNTNIQFLYFSCHGSTTGLSYSERSGPYVTYDAFAHLLSDAIDPRARAVEIAVGACEAMSEGVDLENQMPSMVSWVSGFTGCPSPEDVAALAASRIQDDTALMAKLSAASDAACGNGLSMFRMRQAVDALLSITDSHEEKPEREVRSDQGCAIVIAERQGGGATWTRRTIPLPPLQSQERP